MGEITFLSGDMWDGGRMVALFWASMGDQHVSCAISFEAPRISVIFTKPWPTDRYFPSPSPHD
jgi:hypothetical protein